MDFESRQLVISQKNSFFNVFKGFAFLELPALRGVFCLKKYFLIKTKNYEHYNKINENIEQIHCTKMMIEMSYYH